MKNRIIDYIIILVFAIVISIPLMSADFNIYGDDGIQHIARLMGTYQTITEGEFPPVIMSNFCNGFGYSWNIFYSPFTAYLPLIFSIFTNSFGGTLNFPLFFAYSIKLYKSSFSQIYIERLSEPYEKH